MRYLHWICQTRSLCQDTRSRTTRINQIDSLHLFKQWFEIIGTDYALRFWRTLSTFTSTKGRIGHSSKSLCHTVSSIEWSEILSLIFSVGEPIVLFVLQFRQCRDEKIEADVTMVFEAIKKIRSYRSENNIIPKQADNRKTSLFIPSLNPLRFSSVYIRTSAELQRIFSDYTDLIQPLAKIDQIHYLTEDPTDGYINIGSKGDYNFYFKSQ